MRYSSLRFMGAPTSAAKLYPIAEVCQLAGGPMSEKAKLWQAVPSSATVASMLAKRCRMVGFISFV